MCIHVFQNGHHLTVPFMHEQICVRPEGNQLKCIQLFDFSIKSLSGPLNSFRILYPHRIVALTEAYQQGEDCARVDEFPTDLEKEFTWYYSALEPGKNGEILLKVANYTDGLNTPLLLNYEHPPAKGLIGIDNHMYGEKTNKMIWRGIGYTLFMFEFSPGEEPRQDKAAWIRLAIEPYLTEIDYEIEQPLEREAEIPLQNNGIRFVVTSPLNMLSNIDERCRELADSLEKNPPEESVPTAEDFDLFRQHVLNPLQDSNTSTIYRDHRISVLHGPNAWINSPSSGCEDNIKFHNETAIPKRFQTRKTTKACIWLTGAKLFRFSDASQVSQEILGELEKYGPRTKEDLTRAVGVDHAAGCRVIDMLKDLAFVEEDDVARICIASGRSSYECSKRDEGISLAFEKKIRQLIPSHLGDQFQGAKFQLTINLLWKFLDRDLLRIKRIRRLWVFWMTVASVSIAIAALILGILNLILFLK